MADPALADVRAQLLIGGMTHLPPSVYDEEVGGTARVAGRVRLAEVWKDEL